MRVAPPPSLASIDACALLFNKQKLELFGCGNRDSVAALGPVLSNAARVPLADLAYFLMRPIHQSSLFAATE